MRSRTYLLTLDIDDDTSNDEALEAVGTVVMLPNGVKRVVIKKVVQPLKVVSSLSEVTLLYPEGGFCFALEAPEPVDPNNAI